MANAIVQHITKESVGAAIRSLAIEYAHDPTTLRALENVERRLYSCLWQWYSDRKRLVLESASQRGRKSYIVERGQCREKLGGELGEPCPAARHGRHCWHAQAWETFVVAETIRPRRTAEDYARIQREAAELA
jgi:hypothetical protein